MKEQEDLKDYLYDAAAMRSLAGKKLHKKKNHLNAFFGESMKGGMSTGLYAVLTGTMCGSSWTDGGKTKWRPRSSVPSWIMR